MSLFKATYETISEGRVMSEESYLYVLAPDFQTAAKLASDNKKISGVLKMAGNPACALTRIELLAADIVQE